MYSYHLSDDSSDMSEVTVKHMRACVMIVEKKTRIDRYTHNFIIIIIITYYND